MPLLKISCFGHFTILLDDKPLIIRHKKLKELIAYLLCQNNTIALKSRIAEALWPDAEPTQALNNLYKLCRYVKEYESLPLVIHRNEIALEPISCSYDLKQFESLYAEGTTASYEQAVNLYCGPLFAEDYYTWSSEYEAKYDLFYYQILEFLIEAYKIKNPQLSKYYKQLYAKLS